MSNSDTIGGAAVRAESRRDGIGLWATSMGAAGVFGQSYAAGQDGIYGEHTAKSGVGFGIRGITRSSGPGTSGVYGASGAATGETYGVRGITVSSQEGTAGVKGETIGSSGQTYGIEGITRSPTTGAAGVRGEAVESSGVTHGVFGQSNGTGGRLFEVPFYASGVVGRSTATTGAAIATAGVVGENDSGSGVGHGVVGKTVSNNDEAAAVKGLADGVGCGVAAASSGTALRVRGYSRSTDGSPTPQEHAAHIYDDEFAYSSVLAVQTNDVDPLATTSTNFITFYDGQDTAVGAVEGDGNGALTYSSGSADYAEYLPRLDPDEDIDPAEVVGLVGGAITRRAADAEQASVVSSQPIVTGNSPGQDPAARSDHEPVAFVGQVPVKVRGTVAEGDLIVPSGEDDGTARAIDPAGWRPGDGPLVGRAWEASDGESVEQVTVAVGLETGEALEDAVAGLAEELDGRDERIARLEGENEALRERLDGLEERLARIEKGQGSPAVADD